MLQTGKQRIDQEPAFLLTSVPWRESSLRVEVFSRHYGRLSLLARSARKRQSELRGILVPFVPISLSWYGVNELRTLHRAEWIGGWGQPKQLNLLSALYVNELVLKMTAREDPCETLFDAISGVMQTLSTASHIQGALRIFEWQLLQSCGYAPDITSDINGNPIDDDATYLMQPESPPVLMENDSENAVIVHGSTLKALSKQDFQSDEALREALILNRMFFNFRLPENLCSRRIMQQLMQY